MRILTTSAALGSALLLALAGASPSFAKAHNNGFGAMSTGAATPSDFNGGVLGGAQRSEGGGSAGSYGQRDQVPEVRADQAAGIHGNSMNAQDRGTGSGHPSERSGQ